MAEVKTGADAPNAEPSAVAWERLSSENRQLFWATLGWLPGGRMPDPDLIPWADINRLMDAARAGGR